MNPVVTAEPTEEPIGLAMLKKHLRLDPDYAAEDDYLARLAKRVRKWAEGYCWRSFAPQTRKATYGAWACDYFRLAYGPVTAVTEIAYTLEDGASSTFSVANTFLDASHEPARLYLKDGQSWPGSTLRKAAGIEITYTCGFAIGDPEIEDAIGAMLLRAESLYNNRGDEVVGVNVIPTKLENSAESLLDLWVAR